MPAATECSIGSPAIMWHYRKPVAIAASLQSTDCSPSPFLPLAGKLCTWQFTRRGSLNVDNHLDVVDREEACLAVHRTFVPVLVNATNQVDDVAFSKAKFPLVLGVEVVQGLAAWFTPCKQTWSLQFMAWFYQYISVFPWYITRDVGHLAVSFSPPRQI